MGGAKMRRFEATDEEHRVTTLELFFDLVFVFAFTQITALMAKPSPGESNGQAVARGLVLLALLWFAWAAYSWLGNQARADEGVLRLSMSFAMGAILIAALTVPEAWNDGPGGLYGPMVLALAIASVRLIHLVTYVIAAGEDTVLRRQLALTAIPVLTAAALLVAGAAVGGRGQTVLWLLALLVDYGGIILAGSSGWRLRSPSHFAERHGLIIIVALGESIVAIGVGVAAVPISGPIVAAALLGLSVSLALWWLYFDVVALAAEKALTALPAEERPARARNSYSYLHLPMVAGIVIMAVGLKKVSTYVADTEVHALSDPLATFPLIMLFVGPALYLLAHVAFRWINVHSLSRQRVLTAAALVLAIPLCAAIPALASLAVLAVILGALVTYEVVRYREARYRIRHAREEEALGHTG